MESSVTNNNNNNNNNKVIIEVCVDSIESSINAVKGGAGRIELCSALFLGGLTPTYGMMRMVKERLPPSFPVNVMIRPREGDFLYSADEIQLMKHDIDMVKQIGFHGIVLGVLTADGRIDIPLMREFIQYASPLSVTFHRAFDMCRDYKEGIQDLISLGGGIDRLLTSGLESSVMEGIDTINSLLDLVKDHNIIVMPGGGVTERNITKIVNLLSTPTHRLKEIHLSGRVKHDSQMQFRNSNVYMGGDLRNSEYTKSIVDDKRIGNFVSLANSSKP